MATLEETAAVGKVLCDITVPLKARFKALFVLKSIGTSEAVKCIANSFQDDSSLLKHELAYVLGQIGNEEAVSVLEGVLQKTDMEPIVRHESGEALGALGKKESLPLLLKHCFDEEIEVAQTCQIASERILWLHSKEGEPKGPVVGAVYSSDAFTSVDPAPPLPDQLPVKELCRILLNEKESLFVRYRAMFSLRNMGGDEAVQALCQGLECPSALFRHEVAFVLGQMQDSGAVDALSERLTDTGESPMVRHEAAESLGSIATEECTELLQLYLTDSERIVRESCEVALDMSDYVNGNEFQYADTLQKLHVR